MIEDDDDFRLLERGDIRFAARLRPPGGHAHEAQARTVQRFALVLAPELGGLARRVVVARGRLPAIGEDERTWAYVERVGDASIDLVDDLEQVIAFGVYRILEHADHAHLSYILKSKDAPDHVLSSVNVLEEESFLVAMLHDGPGRRRVGEPLDPAFLDVEGTELCFTGAQREDPDRRPSARRPARIRGLFPW